MRLIYSGMQARLIDGTIIPVRGMVLDPASHCRLSIVLGANGFFGPDVMAPAEAIWLVDDDVHLALTCDEVAALPVFHRYPAILERERVDAGHYIPRQRRRGAPPTARV